jgi:hypothetical protein
MKCTNASVSCLTLAAVAAMATTTLDPAAIAGGEKDRDISTKTLVISGDGPSAKAEAHTFEVTVADGEVTVIIDGKSLEANQFRVEDGEVLILDEDGNEVKSFDVMLGGGGDDFHITWAGQEPFIDIQTVFPQGAPKVLVGVHLDEPDEALLYHLRLEKGQTTMIRGLYKGLPAHKAGLDRYDIIVAVEGRQPADPKSILEVLAEKEPGDEVKFTVIQKGRTKEISVTLEAFDGARMDPSQLIGGSAFSRNIFIPGEGDLKFGPGLPDMKRFEILIDPESRQRFKRLEQFSLPEGFHKELQEQLQERIPRDLDKHMESLNDRLTEMQEMINQLVEQARQLAEEAEEDGSY